MIERAFAGMTEGRGSIRSALHLLAACLWEAWRDRCKLERRLDVHRQRAA